MAPQARVTGTFLVLDAAFAELLWPLVIIIAEAETGGNTCSLRSWHYFKDALPDQQQQQAHGLVDAIKKIEQKLMSRQ